MEGNIYIFGANGGIGRVLVEELRKRYVHGDDWRDSSQVFAAFRTDCNVSSEGQVMVYVKQQLRPGPIHIINATGVSLNGMIHKMSLEDFEHSLQVNLTSNFLLLKHSRARMKENPGSSFLMLSSVVSELGIAGTSAYSASKAALCGLTKTAAREFAPFARVNCLELGYFDTGIIKQVPDEMKAKLCHEIPLGRLGDPKEVVEAVEFTLQCSYLTGAVIPVNGGLR